MDLKGKKALVTGGSRGIGRAIVCNLARHGAAVAVNYLGSHAVADDLVTQIISAGGQALRLPADVRSNDEAKRLVEMAIDRLGGLDILVNNVGEFFFSRLAETTREKWDDILNSNLSSVFTLCNLVLPTMRKQRGGCILNVGLSPADRVRGAPNIAPYSIAKTGVLILTRSLAIEEARHNIRINCVSPGLIDNGYLPPEQKVWMEKRTPMGRLGTTEEVARAVIFLASDQASYISGANLAVSGAWDWEDRPTNHDDDVQSLFGNI